MRSFDPVLRSLVALLGVLALGCPVHAETCDGEEARRCGTCEDGIDNDGSGRIDAEDPACATLADYQRAAIVLTRPAASDVPATSLDGVLLPGGLVGEPVDGHCDAPTAPGSCAGSCACPEASPVCQAAGRPCGSDEDCRAVPYPLGASRAGVCAGSERENDPATRCRPESDLVTLAHSIGRIPGEAIDPIRVGAEAPPLFLSFDSGRHIVDVDAVEIGPESEVVLLGKPDTVIVARVRGRLVLGSGAALTTGGELGADRLLWVFAGEEGRVVLGDGSRFAGTILAPTREAVEVGEGARIRGAILAADLTSLR